MGEGFYISKRVAVICVVAAVGAVVTIVALSVVCAKEKLKNQQTPSSTDEHTTTATSVFTTPSSPAEPWHHYRLPETLWPVFYNMTLQPRLKPTADGLYIFTGHSRVVFTCVRDTDLILVHSGSLTFKMLDEFHARLKGLDGASAPSLKKSWLEVPTQYLVVQLNSLLLAGRQYELYTEFTGELSNALVGFYRSEYTEDGVTKVVATTQMQPTNARKAFPCFDEPAMKAVFHVTLIHPHGTVALSNTMNYKPLNITVNGEMFLKTSFEPTEIMSTYLLAFVVCEFAYIQQDADVLIRVWARRKAIEEGLGDYALAKTGPVLAFFEDYHKSSYPLKKSDQIALPDFFAGAMENWGLITYRETSLFYDPGLSSVNDKKWVIKTISHELAHMWFGNLVTMRWWNDLWLNEGFATYLSYLGADYAEPNMDMKTSVLIEIHAVMAVDALTSSHPLSSKEEDIMTPDHIMAQFDSITYKKGAAVLRMLSGFITEKVFKEGLRTYLDEFQYKNTVNKDLWKHLQMAVDKAGVLLPHPVEDIMNRWVLQMGFPVVTVDTQTGKITQKHFLLDPESEVYRPSEFNYEWFVPITWVKNNTVGQQFWLLSKEDTHPSLVCDQNEWLLVNRMMTGFYKVNYDDENWERLCAMLRSRHQDIPVFNRAQIIDDAFNLAKVGMVNITVALQTTTFLHKEVEYLPWETAMRHLHYFFSMFDRTELYGPLQAYRKKQVTPLFQHFKNLTLNFTKTQEKHIDQYNLVNAVSLACSTGVEGCRDLTTGWFKEWMKNPAVNKISPDLKTTVYCNAIEAGGVAEWYLVWIMYKISSVSLEASQFAYSLSCTKLPWLLNRYLQYCLDPAMVPKQEVSSTIVHIANNPVGQPLAWDFVRANWKHLLKEVGVFSFGTIIYEVTGRFNSEFEHKQLLQFMEDIEEQLGSGVMLFEKALERTKANVNWATQNKKLVHDWFVNETL